MTQLTAKQQAFIDQMKEDEELARYGFSLLLKRPDFVRFFDALEEAGLFDAERNPAPVPAPEEGYVRIPYWSALDYLRAVAAYSGEHNDEELSQKVMKVVRSVSTWQDKDGQIRENYHTAHRFTEILGLVNSTAVSSDDMKLIGAWVNNRFERMLVSTALNEIVFPKFLNTSARDNWEKAVAALREVTAIEFRREDKLGDPTPKTIVEDYWLRELISTYAETFGSKLGREAALTFIDRLKQVFASDIHKEHSTIFRPAVEDHEQNHQFRSAENLMVEGLRNVLIGWINSKSQDAGEFVRELLTDDLEVVRRIAIYVLDSHWAELRHLYPTLVAQNLFQSGHLHELYRLLKNHFIELSPEEKKQTLDSLRALPDPTWAEDPPSARKRAQLRWLLAMAGQGDTGVDEWLAQLTSDPAVGAIPEHPDFSSYMTVGYGPGASPFSVSELVGFLTARVLTRELNAFKPSGQWRSPTIEGLTSTIQEAARTSPETFLQCLPDLLELKLTYQQAMLRGLREAWNSKEQASKVDWSSGWEQLIRFFESMLKETDRWLAEEKNTRDWTLADIAETLHAGTQHDEHAYDVGLLPRTQAILTILLDRAAPAGEPSDDPMLQALNTARGRVLDAVFGQALRAARVDDKSTGGHANAWKSIEELFTKEMNACKNANFEFSTFCGAYLSQLDYLSRDWTMRHVGQIFSKNYPENEKCAIGGLSYAAFTERVYQYLLDSKVLERALGYDLRGREIREKLVERIAGAYLWGLETLDSPRFAPLFSPDRIQDLQQAAWVFWTVRGQELSEEQLERVILFWDRCVNFAHALPTRPAKLLSSLSGLASHLSTLEARTRDLLVAVAPFVHLDHNAYEFIEQLLRLAPSNPNGVAAALEAMVRAHIPEYDYENQLQELLRTLLVHGKREEVIRISEIVRVLPGMKDIFDEATRTRKRV